jgi:rubrerythrin
MEENPIKIAIKMEVDGMNFYKNAAENTSNALGKKMFLSFVEDEKKHLKALEEVFKGADKDTLESMFQSSDPRERIKTVFSSASEEVAGNEASKADPDDIKALEMAIQFEKDGYGYYLDKAETAESVTVRELFKMLADEEESHLEMLTNTHTFLTDTGNWFLWDEEGVIDGG